MRLPLARIYRAFPELDVFTNEECERFVIRVRSWSGPVAKFAGWCWFWFGTGAFLLGFGLLSAAGSLFSAPRPPDQSRSLWDLSTLAIAAIVLAGGVGGIYFLSLLLRDWLLIRAIRLRVLLANCPKCEQSMLGVPCEEGSVRCPECGTLHALAKLGLTPEDLRPSGGPRPA